MALLKRKRMYKKNSRKDCRTSSVISNCNASNVLMYTLDYIPNEKVKEVVTVNIIMQRACKSTTTHLIKK